MPLKRKGKMPKMYEKIRDKLRRKEELSAAVKKRVAKIYNARRKPKQNPVIKHRGG